MQKSLEKTLEKKGFGFRADDILYLHSLELHYLTVRKTIENLNNTILTFLEKKLSKTQHKLEYLVYSKLRRSFIVKPTKHFGGNFQLYENQSEHSTTTVLLAKEKTKLKDLLSSLRVAESVKKKLWIVYIDEQLVANVENLHSIEQLERFAMIYKLNFVKLERSLLK